MPIDNNENKEFKPVIVAFCCNWCSYAGADLASFLSGRRKDHPCSMFLPCQSALHLKSIPEGR